MILDDIAARKRIEVEEAKRLRPIETLKLPVEQPRDFGKALQGVGSAVPRVTAEVKDRKSVV